MVVVKVAGVTSVLDFSIVSPFLMNSTKESGVRLTVSFMSPTLVSIFSSFPAWCQALTSTWSTPKRSLVLLIQLGLIGWYQIRVYGVFVVSNFFSWNFCPSTILLSSKSILPIMKFLSFLLYMILVSRVPWVKHLPIFQQKNS